MQTSCTGNDKVCDFKFYVAPVNAQAILGLNDCVQLGLVKRVCDLQTELSTKDAIRDNRPVHHKNQRMQLNIIVVISHPEYL